MKIEDPETIFTEPSDLNKYIESRQILEQIKITNLKQNWWKGGCIPLKLSNTITHIAKPPYCHIDIYSEYLAKEYSHIWKVETWIRGHHILEESLTNNNNKNLSCKLV